MPACMHCIAGGAQRHSGFRLLPGKVAKPSTRWGPEQHGGANQAADSDLNKLDLTCMYVPTGGH
jgi:hypothetical protein